MKKNESLSVPVSRVSSSQRLKTTVSPSATGSFPSTPYQVSSLNPMRASSKVNKSTNEQFENEFENLLMVHTVDKFAESLSNLSKKVTSFEASEFETTVKDLLKANESMMSQFSELDKHKELGSKIDDLSKENTELDNRAKDILRKLIQYRAELKSLPKLPTKRDEQTTAVKLDVEEVLRYGMKLSKFTKAPPTINGGALQTHPNNYIWPAEDALRRGTLAISSLRGDEIIRNELDGDVQEKEEAKEEAEEDKEQPQAETSSEVAPQPEKVEALDLDLFNPDDENYSD